MSNSVDRLFLALEHAAAAGVQRPRMRFTGITVSLSFSGAEIYVNSAIDGAYLGKIVGNGFSKGSKCDAGRAASVLAVMSDPLAYAVAYGRETGSCSCCGRELSDPISVERGVGPVCLANYRLSDLPVGATPPELVAEEASFADPGGSLSFSPQQEQAIRAVKAWLADPNRKPFFYLAGYAGTGKTTLAKLLAADAGKVVFAAFTGKAALVLGGKGCSPSSTIHSLIYQPKEDASGIVHFVLDLEGPASEADLIVVDEVSMVGPDLGKDLLKFGKPVLVLGDPAQLPPVGDEVGFFTKNTPDFMLTDIHRQAADNPIIRMSMIVREGGKLPYGEYGDSLVIRRDQLGRNMVLGADQVLCGTNKTRRSKNAQIRQLLGREGWFTEGERVVGLKNNKEKGFLNGSMWTVQEVDFSDTEESQLVLFPLDAGMAKTPVEVRTSHLWIEGREKELPPSEAREYDPVDYGYVLSVHKSQGSQWNSVVVLDESFVFKQDAARHLYTAITRAAERVIVAR